MNSFSIDINADVGEGLGNESKLMSYLSSCNIACGGHAGDIETMHNVVRLAKSNSVKIGAHPSFPDKANFGRIIMNMSAADLYSSLKAQIRTLQNVLHKESAQLHHVKPHGALYNLAVNDEKTAKVIIEVIKSIALPVALYVPYKSVVADLAVKEQINVIYEAFADRNYNDDLTLVSRTKNNAIINDKNSVLEHLLRMVKQQKVKSINGVEVAIQASTFCIHGDTENAVQILEYLNTEMSKHNIVIR